MNNLEALDTAKWNALVALAEGVKAVQAANRANAPEAVAHALAEWLDQLEGDYSAAAQAYMTRWSATRSRARVG